MLLIMLFIDTCYLLSLINEKAKKHKDAKKLSLYIDEEETLINSTVLLEILNRLKKKERYAKYRNKVINLLYNMDNIHYLTLNDYDNALSICEYYSFKVNYSDCTILETMKLYNVTNIVSYDSDFDKIKGIRRIYF